MSIVNFHLNISKKQLTPNNFSQKTPGTCFPTAQMGLRAAEMGLGPRLNTHALFEALVKSNGGSLLMEKASQAHQQLEFCPWV